jgi:hypothetical protein
MTYSKRFVVKPGAKVNLRKVDPSYVDPDLTEQDALAETKLAGLVPSWSGQLGWDRGCGAAIRSGRGRAARRVLQSLRPARASRSGQRASDRHTAFCGWRA